MVYGPSDRRRTSGWSLELGAGLRPLQRQEKSGRPPHLHYVERLNTRNEFLIASYHPLRPTLIDQTGESVEMRTALLRRAFDQVTVGGARAPWVAPEELSPAF